MNTLQTLREVKHQMKMAKSKPIVIRILQIIADKSKFDLKLLPKLIILKNKGRMEKLHEQK